MSCEVAYEIELKKWLAGIAEHPSTLRKRDA
jgi:hypothetical protein